MKLALHDKPKSTSLEPLVKRECIRVQNEVLFGLLGLVYHDIIRDQHTELDVQGMPLEILEVKAPCRQRDRTWSADVLLLRTTREMKCMT
jgi:hypothetical protein